MKNIKLLFLTVLFLGTYSCKQAKKETKGIMENVEATIEETNNGTEVKTLKFSMEPKSDSNVEGEVSFTEENGTVSMKASLTGLTPGEHAIHIHEKADCSSADGKSTGGHWNPTFATHGKWGSTEGYHRGDIGNFVADSQGNATVEFSTDEWCLGCADDTKNLIGKGVIVHQGVDDYVTQPTGDAGGRISCAGIIE
ncbi:MULTISPECIES: superoxide dismutase family protein [unclassified Arenibacter]|jgi:Cu-Zn family superoxide dismutase|uniref:superoxide dismutase family protein n=1 Tax=unclassified Arenibacter TaxID=2615047 RepID=UPI000E351440|nr:MULTISPECIES: superoxide dismutase family protein [unclassified Arenibacter]MCM4163077.1 superoxide dismutase [Arenibacter sp. A80]RFT57111.1 superoxide dismutase family protein [Arenibacter sp. P308M17]